MRDGAERVDGFSPGRIWAMKREQGTSQALLTADLTASPNSLVEAWTLIFGIDPESVGITSSYRPGGSVQMRL
jgi:hypothetical protein